MITRVGWRFVDWASALLERHERDAVLGDVAEAGESAVRAFADVTGLVIRRQFSLWKSWRPWLVLAAVVPCSLRLTMACRELANMTSIYTWMYLNNWTPTYIANAAERQDAGQYLVNFLIGAGTIVCFSWGAGFALGFLARRTIAVNGFLFCGISAVAALVVILRPYEPHMMAAFALTVYRVIVPAVFEIALLLIPSVWGMGRGLSLAEINT